MYTAVFPTQEDEAPAEHVQWGEVELDSLGTVGEAGLRDCRRSSAP